jgi:hypothetical protein
MPKSEVLHLGIRVEDSTERESVDGITGTDRDIDTRSDLSKR